MADWEVTVYGAWTDEDYDSPDGIIACWTIYDMTKTEAEEIAAVGVHRMGNEVADWTMEEVA